MKAIAHIHTDFQSKFGLPRQSSIINEIQGKIVFEKPYRDILSVRGLEGFSHLWVIWEFSEAKTDAFSPTVRPPKLGGNKRMGVFATRAPYRPNPIGLTCVKIEKIDLQDKEAPVIYVSGCDMMDGTPIYDIKPYLPYCDSKPCAVGGFAENVQEKSLEVIIENELLSVVPEEKRQVLLKVLSADPRPAYIADGERIYGFEYAGLEIKFKVCDNTLIVTCVESL